jgi:hypothetical protein
MARAFPKALAALALGAAALIGSYGAYLVLFGPILSTVTPGGSAVTATHVPSPAGLIPAVAALLVWLGMLRGKERIAWLGGGLAVAFALLFVFGIGGILVPVAGVLLLSLALRRVTAR